MEGYGRYLHFTVNGRLYRMMIAHDGIVWRALDDFGGPIWAPSIDAALSAIHAHASAA